MGHYPHFTTRRWPGGSQKTLRLHMGIALACERAVSQKEPAHAAHVSFLNRRLFHGRAGTSYPSSSARRDDAPYRSLYIGYIAGEIGSASCRERVCQYV